MKPLVYPQHDRNVCREQRTLSIGKPRELSWRYFDEMAKALAGDLICDPIREAREGILLTLTVAGIEFR